MGKKSKQKISVSCAGCGRTQVLRQSKVCPDTQYFTCSGSCKLNPLWRHPHKPEGFVQVQRMNAAGSFWGHEIRPATVSELASISRAKAIETEGLKRILEKRL